MVKQLNFIKIGVRSLLILVFISCNKSAKLESSQKQEEIAVSKFSSIKEIYKAVDKGKLNEFITTLRTKYSSRAIDEFPVIPIDPLLEEEAAAILQPTNNNILAYLQQNYPSFGSMQEIDVNDPDFTYFAQVYSISEQSGFITPINGTPQIANREFPIWLRCTVELVMGYFDVKSLIDGLGTFEFSTVWRAVKSAVKKYVGWIAAAILIYDIMTECIL